ncbi:MAG: PPC domain-containing protein, partial [Planctomycetes bacterium]|nr:PPC domain-containing protein [Planctomycetota bacterium]
LVFCSANVWAVPHIGYLYPAGAKQGTTVKITVGGQDLRGANKLHISGEGITASVIQSARQPNNLQKEQREYITKRLKELKAKKLNETSGAGYNAIIKKKNAKRKDKTGKAEVKDEAVIKREKMMVDRIVRLPLLYDLDNKSVRELEHVKNILFTPRMMKQINSQLADLLLIEVTVAPDTVPGSYELRVGTKSGLSNPVVFQVGTFAETSELEPNGQDHNLEGRIQKTAAKPKPNPIEIPVVVNGQIMPGDVDRFQFAAKQGQKLVIEAQARSLIPYLADAVPGWFQATLTLYDQKGKEVAFTDDYRFNPDPVLFYQIPKDGKYELEIRDSIYRGREDFVYRISIGQSPFITGMFPLGSRQGAKAVAAIEGWNLPGKSLTLYTRPGGKTIRKINWYKDDRFSNFVPYAVNQLPECSEAASNDTIKKAQKVSLPTIVNGRVEASDDVDVFK